MFYIDAMFVASPFERNHKDMNDNFLHGSLLDSLFNLPILIFLVYYENFYLLHKFLWCYLFFLSQI
jgi:hypothetical protein